MLFPDGVSAFLDRVSNTNPCHPWTSCWTVSSDGYKRYVQCNAQLISYCLWLTVMRANCWLENSSNSVFRSGTSCAEFPSEALPIGSRETPGRTDKACLIYLKTTCGTDVKKRCFPQESVDQEMMRQWVVYAGWCPCFEFCSVPWQCWSADRKGNLSVLSHYSLINFLRERFTAKNWLNASLDDKCCYSLRWCDTKLPSCICKYNVLRYQVFKSANHSCLINTVQPKLSVEINSNSLNEFSKHITTFTQLYIVH